MKKVSQGRENNFPQEREKFLINMNN